MAFTFGGATGDDIAYTAAHAVGGNGQFLFCAGWFYPTTLTAGRQYWSAGSIIGAEVDTTTDQLLMSLDATTDPKYTCDPNIAVNNWYFLAWFCASSNTGPASTYRSWAGDRDTPPIELAVTQTVAPTGTFTGQSNRTIGNKGTGGTVSFQGDIGWMSFLSTNQATNLSFLAASVNGAIAQSEADIVYRRWVMSLWRGDPHKAGPIFANNGSFSVLHLPLNRDCQVFEYSHDPAKLTENVAAPAGATFTDHKPPRSPPENWPLLLGRC